MKLPATLHQGSRLFDVVILGENSIDLVATLGEYPQPDTKRELEDFVERPGGEGASAAVGLSRLGWRTKYIGRFADDVWGQHGKKALVGEGVDVNDCVTVPGVTSRFALILVETSRGSRTVLWKRAPALALEPGDVTDVALGNTRVLLVGSDDVPAMLSAARRAREMDVRTVGDLERVHPQTEALLRQLDVVIVAASFLEAFTGLSATGAGLRALADQSGATLTCVTLGEQGCLAMVEGHEFRVPAFATQPVDTTGAGDLFRAGFIARWLQRPIRPDVEDLLRYGAAVAALNCRGRGAWAGAPRAPEVDEFLQSWGG